MTNLKPRIIIAGLAGIMFNTFAGSVIFAAPASQPAAIDPAPFVPTSQPAIAPTSQPAGVAASQPADTPTTQPAADGRHKQFDERWRQMNETQRNAARTRWTIAPIAQTFKSGAMVNLTLVNGLLNVETTDLTTAMPVRVAVEGSNAVYMLSHPRAAMINRAFGNAAGGNFFNLTRYDFDATDETPWQSRILINNVTTTLVSQNVYGTTNLIQTNGMVNLRVAEYLQLGQPMKVVCAAQAASLTQLRSEHPEEFRLYVLPLLAQFSDPSFLQPGATDVYSVFVEVPADEKVVHDLQQLIPGLDADDPADREAASTKLRQIGAPAALAALRMDDRQLSEEQKLRLKAFIATFRRLATTDPASQRHDLGFLIDCLEFEDIAVRNAAKTELQMQTHQPIEFDTTLTESSAATATDALRKQLLTVPAAPATVPSSPATQPSPQT